LLNIYGGKGSFATKKDLRLSLALCEQDSNHVKNRLKYVFGPYKIWTF